MALPPIKVLIAEKDGVELDYHEEYDLKASAVPFTRAGFTSDNVNDAINEAATGQVGVNAVSQAITYDSEERPDLVTVYDDNTQIVANRVQDFQHTYTGDVPTTVVQQDYDSDGTTVLKTTTFTLTWVGDLLDKVTSNVV